jgi:hypothetical protein
MNSGEIWMIKQPNLAVRATRITCLRCLQGNGASGGGKGTVKLSVGELEGGGSAMCVFCDFW